MSHALVFVSPASRVAMRVAQLRLGTFFCFSGTPGTPFLFAHCFFLLVSVPVFFVSYFGRAWSRAQCAANIYIFQPMARVIDFCVELCRVAVVAWCDNVLFFMLGAPRRTFQHTCFPCFLWPSIAGVCFCRPAVRSWCATIICFCSTVDTRNRIDY